MSTRPTSVRRALLRACAVVIALGVSLGISPLGPTPAQAVGGSSDWLSVSSGTFSTCGVRANHRIYCWGDNNEGQLGDGTTDDRHVPTPVHTSLADWTSVSVGSTSTCALRRNGRLYCWGANYAGQLGINSTAYKTVPTQVYGARTDWSSVDVGESAACARRTSGRLYCWGDNTFGRLGNGNTTTAKKPAQVWGGSTAWTSYSVGTGQTCALKNTKRMYCWGHNADGQLGNGGTADRHRPTAVSGGMSWSTLSVGEFATCGVRTTGKLYCWGNNNYGQLGNGATANKSTPFPVSSSAKWTAVSMGLHFACGRKTSGQVACWGENAAGEVGNGTQGAPRLTPATLVGHATDWRVLSNGGYHACATTSSHRLYCWGYDYYGQLGDNTTNNQLAPNEVYAP